jgi:hypothetical protein
MVMPNTTRSFNEEVANVKAQGYGQARLVNSELRVCVYSNHNNIKPCNGGSNQILAVSTQILINCQIMSTRFTFNYYIRVIFKP